MASPCLLGRRSLVSSVRAGSKANARPRYRYHVRNSERDVSLAVSSCGQYLPSKPWQCVLSQSSYKAMAEVSPKARSQNSMMCLVRWMSSSSSNDKKEYGVSSLGRLDEQAATQLEWKALLNALAKEAMNSALSARAGHKRRWKSSNPRMVEDAVVARSFATQSDKKDDDLRQQRTEKDFEDYLMGKPPSNNKDKIDETSKTLEESATNIATRAQDAAAAASRPPPPSQPFVPSPESPLAKLPTYDSINETYHYVQRSQRTNWEKAHARTASNVRRALLGNLIIAASKLAAWVSSGSSAMLSEFVHSVVDCGNQSLLLLGLRDSRNDPDRRHPYGYGKSVYFWALVSALGTFFLGAGVSMTHAIGDLLSPHPALQEITWQVWGVLGLSITVDGYVFWKTLAEIRKDVPKHGNFWNHLWSIRDPATLAILLEDGAACLGVLVAIGGIGATSATGMPFFDSLAGVGIAGLLAAMGLVLVRVNHSFLLGQAIDAEMRAGIEKILLARRSIDHVHSVQSQWTGPETFSYKAEVDFDGTYLAAKLMPRYQQEFLKARDSLDQDLRVLLSWYAEDVMRTVEREVRHIETEIRKEYPGAEYIELEPMSKDADRFAIDDGMEEKLRKIEIEALNRYLKSLYTQPTAAPAASATSAAEATLDRDTTAATKAITGRETPRGESVDHMTERFWTDKDSSKKNQ